MPAPIKKKSDIRVGVVGYGGAFNMGRRHFEEMKKAGMVPVAVVEIDPARRAEAQKDFPGIETYTSVKELTQKSKANLVTLITPHNTHAPLALEVLRSGRHVVAEKPFAITTAECDAMIAEGKKKKLVVSTYHNRHWDGVILQALKTIRSGALGKIHRIECHMGAYGAPRAWWRSSKSISGGILYDWGVHLLEYSLQILDSEMTEVTGFAKNGFWASKPGAPFPKDANEDEATAIVRFKSGAWLSLTLTSLDANPKKGIIEISGEKGTYIMDQGSWEMISQDGAGKTTITKGKNPPDEGWRFYENIANHLVKKEPLVITGEWARRPIHIIDLAGRSAKLGKSIPVKYS